MNKKIKKRWVEALRSGKYKQGKNVLRDVDNNFCCLGVLCNLHAQVHPESAKEETNPNHYMGKFSFLPKEVALWAEFTDEEWEETLIGVDVGTPEGSLSLLNDAGYNFKRIAKVIDRYL
ncbi:hypothetical protein [Microcystis sp. M42BS1]|uniref:hypothetical protein n=1 Tax=Microcystis sp. M42BS1 TaxID=2771192 RepID=UPI0025881FBF|nr:hypothetical protein [Microcystis sp. M42BS1]MCA2570675.1 hypothetical protein [Microcystis sp. M42BS1]